jgi:hypothetical protein
MNINEIVSKEIPPESFHKGVETLNMVEGALNNLPQEVSLRRAFVKAVAVWAFQKEAELTKALDVLLANPIPVDMSAKMVAHSDLKHKPVIAKEE